MPPTLESGQENAIKAGVFSTNLMGRNFVNPFEVEHLPTSQGSDLSERDVKTEDEECLDVSPTTRDLPFLSAKRMHAYGNIFGRPSSGDEEVSNPNDSDFHPSNKRHHRSISSTTRTRRQIRKRLTFSDNAAEQQATSSRRKGHLTKEASLASSLPVRPFFCLLMPYGCTSTFPSKNEWKRHLIRHVKLGYWRCELCQPHETGSYSDFNRKDLFTQHLKRMHADSLAHDPLYQQLAQPVANADGSIPEVIMLDAVDHNKRKYQFAAAILDALVKRCFIYIRALPTRCCCPLCDACHFAGETAWEERIEHMAGHFEQIKRGSSHTKVLRVEDWKEDQELSEWLLEEGIVEKVDEKWRLGDGRPMRLIERRDLAPPSLTAVDGRVFDPDIMSKAQNHADQPSLAHASAHETSPTGQHAINMQTTIGTAINQGHALSNPASRTDTSESSFESDGWSDFGLPHDWDLPGTAQSRLKWAIVGHLIMLYASNTRNSFGDDTNVQHNAADVTNDKSSGSQPTSSKAATSTNKPPKRKQDKPPNEGDNKRGKPLQPSCESNEAGDSRLLACPFYKNNPIRYRKCRTKLLRNIPRVKWHIRRCHQLPIYCDRCSMTFEIRNELSEHLRQSIPCEISDLIQWDAITEEQKRELSKRLSSKNSARENWYHIYSILFPNCKAPNSPYHDRIESTQLLDVLNFAEREGSAIITELISEQLQSLSIPHEEVGGFIQDFLSALFERWESENRPISGGQLSRAENRTPQMPADSSSQDSQADGTGVPMSPVAENVASSVTDRPQSILPRDPHSNVELTLVSDMDDPPLSSLQYTDSCDFNSWLATLSSGVLDGSFDL